MYRSIAQILNLPFYLWLLGIYPVLFLYAENLGLVFDHEVLTVAVLMLSATTFGFLVTNIVLGNRHRTAFLLGICSLAFSLSGHVHEFAFVTISLDSWTEIAVIATGVVLYIMYQRVSAQSYERITTTANLLLTALLILPVVTIASDLLSRSDIVFGSAPIGASSASGQAISKINDSPAFPDIYYIVPDGYPSDRWSQEAMNYDNSEFSGALRERGFVVAEDAQCNYAITLLSMASILNMQHFNSNASGFSDLDYLRLSIADSEVALRLKQRGYSYIVLLSGTLFPSSMADINRDFGPSGPIELEIVSDTSVVTLLANSAATQEQLTFDKLYRRSFVSLFLDTTLLAVEAHRLEALIQQDSTTRYDWVAADRFLRTVEEIEAVAAMPAATFTVAHILKPHRPVVFNEHGEVIPDIANPGRTEYLAELRFVNRRLLQMIDMILENSQNEPVIILQADHGSTYGAVRTEDERLIHFDTYSAMHIPETYSIEIPESFTLINSFPIVLNAVFDTNIGLQDNRLYEALVGYEDIFSQEDVTDIFRHR